MQSDDDGHTLIPVGAGALQSAHAPAWLSSHPGPVVAVLADPVEVYRRRGERNANRSLKKYIATEYSSRRMAIYHLASHQCDVSGRSLGEARGLFLDVLRTVQEDGV